MKKLLTIIIAVVLITTSCATLFACKKETYTISYTIDGVLQDSATPTTYQKSFKEIELWQPPAQEGYSFDGWYVSSNYSSVRAESIPSNATGNMNYYGRYIKDSYSIEYYIDGEKANEGTYSKPYNTAVNLWMPTEEDGFIFEGWYENENLIGDIFTQIPGNVIGDKVFYGSFYHESQAEFFSISYTIDGVLQNSASPKRYIQSENPRTLWIPLFDSEKLRFDGWYENENFTGVPVKLIPANTAENKEYYGRFIEPEGYSIGKVKAPRFTAIDKDGNGTLLSSFYGKKPVMINAWRTDCTVCKSEMPDFQKVYLDMGEEVEFLMISVGESVGTVKEFFNNNKSYTFPYYIDADLVFAKAYDVNNAVPKTYFIDMWGYFSRSPIYIAGKISESTLRTEIQKSIDATK